VQGQVAQLRERTANGRVRLGLQTADQHVVEGEQEHEGADQQGDET
jgi:hypothetical protein